MWSRGRHHPSAIGYPPPANWVLLRKIRAQQSWVFHNSWQKKESVKIRKKVFQERYADSDKRPSLRTEVNMTRRHWSDPRTITATEMKRNFSAIVRRLRRRREYAIIQSSGAPVAVLLSLEQFNRLVAYSRRKAAFHDLARNLGREVERRGISEEEFMLDLEKTKRRVFTEQYGRPA